MHRPFLLFTMAGLVFLPVVQAANFNITSGTDTSAKTLAAGETGTVGAGGTLAIAGSTTGVTLNATSGTTTITNSGTMLQNGTGRLVRNNTSGSPSFVITNNGGALMRTADADTLRADVAGSNWTVNNSGSILSLNPSKAGSQAIDFDAVTSGTVRINNTGGYIYAFAADAIRTGANAIVVNSGTIEASPQPDPTDSNFLSGSDAIDTQARSGVQVTNTGLIKGRHGITGGPSSAGANFGITVTNNAGGVIQGVNGSGVNIDGFNANQSATIVNHGLIVGGGFDRGDTDRHDGDGVDVDAVINLTNSGTIRSLNAYKYDTVENSEGITTGGGTIVNSGLIEGLVEEGNTHAIGLGISIVGVNPSSGARDPMYANTTITNQAGGVIRGQTAYGILIGEPASGFTVTINNEAGATIQGGGASYAAIQTGADNVTINNSGTITAESSGLAINFGAGNDTLNINSGSAAVNGNINGGAGVNTMNVNAGEGQTFSYSGTISNFGSINVTSGRFNLTGATDVDVTVDGGEFKNNGDFGGELNFVAGTLSGTDFSGIALSIGENQTLSPGNSPGTLVSAEQTWASGGTYLWEINRLEEDGGTEGGNPGWDTVQILGELTITATAENPFAIKIDSLDLLASWNPAEDLVFTLATASEGVFGFDEAAFVFDLSAFVDQHDLAGGSFSVGLSGDSIELHYNSVPEPSTVALMIGGGVALWAWRRRGNFKN